jgi:hypothetical protein
MYKMRARKEEEEDVGQRASERCDARTEAEVCLRVFVFACVIVFVVRFLLF